MIFSIEILKSSYLRFCDNIADICVLCSADSSGNSILYWTLKSPRLRFYSITKLKDKFQRMK